MDQTSATAYIPQAREMTEDMVKEGPEWSSGQREVVKTFLAGVSLSDAHVSMG